MVNSLAEFNILKRSFLNHEVVRRVNRRRGTSDDFIVKLIERILRYNDGFRTTALTQYLCETLSVEFAPLSEEDIANLHNRYRHLTAFRPDGTPWPDEDSDSSSSEPSDYEVEEILGHDYNYKSKGLFYNVKWKLKPGDTEETWSDSDNWVKEKDMTGCKDLVKKYHDKIKQHQQKEKIRKSKGDRRKANVNSHKDTRQSSNKKKILSESDSDSDDNLEHLRKNITKAKGNTTFGDDDSSTSKTQNNNIPPKESNVCESDSDDVICLGECPPPKLNSTVESIQGSKNRSKSKPTISCGDANKSSQLKDKQLEKKQISSPADSGRDFGDKKCLPFGKLTTPPKQRGHNTDEHLRIGKVRSANKLPKKKRQYEVEKILTDMTDEHGHWYQVQWKADCSDDPWSDDESASWLLKKDLDCPELLEEYHVRMRKKKLVESKQGKDDGGMAMRGQVNEDDDRLICVDGDVDSQQSEMRSFQSGNKPTNSVSNPAKPPSSGCIANAGEDLIDTEAPYIRKKWKVLPPPLKKRPIPPAVIVADKSGAGLQCSPGLEIQPVDHASLVMKKPVDQSILNKPVNDTILDAKAPDSEIILKKPSDDTTQIPKKSMLAHGYKIPLKSKSPDLPISMDSAGPVEPVKSKTKTTHAGHHPYSKTDSKKNALGKASSDKYVPNDVFATLGLNSPENNLAKPGANRTTSKVSLGKTRGGLLTETLPPSQPSKSHQPSRFPQNMSNEKRKAADGDVGSGPSSSRTTTYFEPYDPNATDMEITIDRLKREALSGQTEAVARGLEPISVLAFFRKTPDTTTPTQCLIVFKSPAGAVYEITADTLTLSEALVYCPELVLEAEDEMSKDPEIQLLAEQSERNYENHVRQNGTGK